jgi:hypothetical protein
MFARAIQLRRQDSLVLIARTIAVSHGGSMSLANQVAGGAQISLTFANIDPEEAAPGC